MTDSYVFIIMALLPLTALMVILQGNPYNALVMRGILGAIAALVYAVFGAADVALTEALVGTLLAMTLYVIAVRSSLVMRVGILKDSSAAAPLTQLLAEFRRVASRHQLRLEVIPYPDLLALEQALMNKEVHATCIEQLQDQDIQRSAAGQQTFHTVVRVHRLHAILQAELAAPTTSLAFTNGSATGEKTS